ITEVLVYRVGASGSEPELEPILAPPRADLFPCPDVTRPVLEPIPALCLRPGGGTPGPDPLDEQPDDPLPVGRPPRDHVIVESGGMARHPIQDLGPAGEDLDIGAVQLPEQVDHVTHEVIGDITRLATCKPTEVGDRFGHHLPPVQVPVGEVLALVVQMVQHPHTGESAPGNREEGELIAGLAPCLLY